MIRAVLSTPLACIRSKSTFGTSLSIEENTIIKIITTKPGINMDRIPKTADIGLFFRMLRTVENLKLLDALLTE